MAMATWLYAVDRSTLDGLRKRPELFGHVDTVGSYSTYVGPSINYFLAGETSPTRQALSVMLDGAETVCSEELENGGFGMVPPDDTRAVARQLAALDISDVRSRIADADLEDLVDEEELYDLELLGPAEASATIVRDIKGLTAFYAEAAAAGHGVLMYTA